MAYDGVGGQQSTESSAAADQQRAAAASGATGAGQPSAGPPSAAALWVRRNVDGPVYGPLVLGPALPPVIAQLAPIKESLKTLDDLPGAEWEVIPPPNEGYNYRTEVYVLGMAVGCLLDTGAATSCISEELLVMILNRALELGVQPDSEEWPLRQLCRWESGDQTATGVAAGAQLSFRGVAVLALVLRGVDGREVRQNFRFKILRRGCAGWLGLIIGAARRWPADQPRRPRLRGDRPRAAPHGG